MIRQMTNPNESYNLLTWITRATPDHMHNKISVTFALVE